MGKHEWHFYCQLQKFVGENYNYALKESVINVCSACNDYHVDFKNCDYPAQTPEHINTISIDIEDFSKPLGLRFLLLLDISDTILQIQY